jgi:uncharacterized protein YfaP (DUF2135 family)
LREPKRDIEKEHLHSYWELMGKLVRLINIMFILSTLVLISACGGGGSESLATETPSAPQPSTVMEYSISGTVSGLVAPQLTIQNNLADEISIDSDGSFVFPTDFETGSNYEVLIIVQPPAQTCSINNASGQVTNQDVTDVTIRCEDNTSTPEPTTPVSEYSISGTVSGLISSQVIIQSNLDDEITVEADGSFLFPIAFQNGATYQIQIIVGKFLITM